MASISVIYNARVRLTISILVLLQSVSMALPLEDSLKPLPVGAVTVGGVLGARVDTCIKNRICGLPQGWHQFVQPFETGAGGGSWIAEFWGKWFTSATLVHHYRPGDSLLALLRQSASALMATQDSDGYIGTYPPAEHFTSWDVWCRKYTMLGLLAYFDETGDTAGLSSLCRLTDNLMANVGPGKLPLTDGCCGGMAAATILEPVVLTYLRTGQAKYLDYANWIAAFMLPEIAGQAAAGTLSGHAYVHMSLCEGLLELYRATGNRTYLDTVLDYYTVILEKEILSLGSGSDNEQWYGTRNGQTAVMAQDNPNFSIGIEACATVTWQKLNEQLLRLTGDSRYADEMEKTMYNMLFRSMDWNTGRFGFHVPIFSANTDWGGGTTWGTDIGCCSANGPRGLLLLPRIAVMRDTGGPVVSLYSSGSAIIDLPQGNHVRLTETTEYPLDDSVIIIVQPDQPADFTIKLRIPSWSIQNSVTINDLAPAATPVPGSYLSLQRVWQAGDVIRLKLDLRGRILNAPSGSGNQAIMRGPIVLSFNRDSSLGLPGNYQFDSADAATIARLASPAGKWAAFSVPLVSCDGEKREIKMFDYATVGNALLWLSSPPVFSAPQRNYVRGLCASVSSSLEVGNWSVANLTDGITAPMSGPLGYTSIAHASSDATEWIEFAFKASVNRIVLYPRMDALAAGGATANFPADFSILYKGECGADSIYDTLLSFKDYPNPQGGPQVFTFPTVNVSAVRIAATQLGLPPVAEASAYRLQFPEIEIGDTLGGTRIDAKTFTTPKLLPTAQLFQSPAGVRIQVNTPGAYTVSVVDISGKGVFRKAGTGPDRFTALARCAQGLYVVRITSSAGTFIQKVPIIH
ncbi:MAG: beta-L-arabinofuranosidase domain-containing protein [Fibrobacterota bacterium]